MAREPQWVKRDLPILQCLVEHFGQYDVPLPVEEIAALTGLSVTSVRAGINSLGRASPSYIEYMFDRGSPPQRPMLVTDITERAWVTVDEVDEAELLAAERLNFDKLNDTEFEEFCYDLLNELGFVNVDWRKGTGHRSSPSDSGRDIVAQLRRSDIDRSEHFETWFVDCKHYKEGIPPSALQNLLTWSNAERPHTALFIASNFLSNPSKDYLANYRDNNHPPFNIKYWERPVLQRLTRGKQDLLTRYHLHGMRTPKEIADAEHQFYDKVWYYRALIHLEKIEDGRVTISLTFSRA